MQDDSDAEMKRLKLELQRTMEMYSTACKEAFSAKQTVGQHSINILGFASLHIIICIILINTGCGAPSMEN